MKNQNEIKRISTVGSTPDIAKTAKNTQKIETTE